MIVVVGAGIAGTAAALVAASRHAAVRVLDGGTGASALGSGAIDGELAGPLEAELRPIANTLGQELGECIVATTAGVLRRAAGADRSVLRLREGGTVFVPESSHPRWRGELLAHLWGATPLAREKGLRFVSTKVALVQGEAEHAMGDVELAARHDDPARLELLAARLREALPADATAVALPPWLGAERARADALSALVGVPCGEVLGDPAGPAGERFVHARDAALAKAGVVVTRARAASFARDDAGLFVTLENGDVIRASTLIVAIGGVAGGGILYTPSAAIAATALPPHPQPTFRASIGGPLVLGLHGRSLVVPGSMFGVPPEELGLPFGGTLALEDVGILASPSERSVLICGDAVADRPRTWLEALASGVRAGTSAASAGPAIAAAQ
jgi:glycerol-3-phosphate dehydrogenase subunit B